MCNGSKVSALITLIFLTASCMKQAAAAMAMIPHRTKPRTSPKLGHELSREGISVVGNGKKMSACDCVAFKKDSRSCSPVQNVSKPLSFLSLPSVESKDLKYEGAVMELALTESAFS